ncbi:MAG: leucine--tRNA ligase [bacterium]
MAYPFGEIEKKWQKYWEENNSYLTGTDTSKPKYYILDMFPYPSGAGLHIGHPEGYTATDIISRYKVMKGFNVLHPMGFDAFGLPTERYCMTTGIHPIVATEKNIENFKRQLGILGLGYDWDREVNTTDPNYYKWSQWMFLLMYNSWFDKSINKASHIDKLPIPAEYQTPEEIENYKDSKRLAFISMIPVNWCEGLGTVLANEEVDEWKGKGYTVERRPMRQWMLRITEYADRLLEDLDLVDWPSSTKDMQINWIGKSNGAEVDFKSESGETIRVFTTRPDTLFGATYMVMAPEHELVAKLIAPEKVKEVEEYKAIAAEKSDLERTELNKDKTGVFIGAYAINPSNGERLPIWISDYVLSHYGTGAIMSVPAHDERDYEFAKKFNLPIKQVVAPKDGSAWDIDESAFCEKSGIGVNSANDEVSLNGLATPEAILKMSEWLAKKGIGEAKVQFKLRDWLFSRQRYWGEPMPIILFKDGTKRGLDPDELPLVLPEVMDFQPAGTGESPLAKVESWINFIDKKTGKAAGYETNTMPQWAGSCWYYLRYIDNKNSEIFADYDKLEYWLGDKGVDLYVGGAEHTVLHLLYARFWHKVLFDYGYVPTKEPFYKLFHQGLIMGEDGEKMSKSRGNVVSPDIVINEFGADSLRLYEMFLGPLEASKPWNTNGIVGVYNFLNRAWRLIVDEHTGELSSKLQDVELTREQELVLNYTIMDVGEDIEKLSFNTAIAQMMIFVNEFTKAEKRPKHAMEKFLLCLAPFAPHIAEELWQRLGHTTSIVGVPFPEYDIAKTIKSEVEVVVQVQSKIRGRLVVALDTPQDVIEKAAKEDPKVMSYLEGKEIKKVIFVKNKLINFIAV